MTFDVVDVTIFGGLSLLLLLVSGAVAVVTFIIFMATDDAGPVAAWSGAIAGVALICVVATGMTQSASDYGVKQDMEDRYGYLVMEQIDHDSWIAMKDGDFVACRVERMVGKMTVDCGDQPINWTGVGDD